MVLTAITEIIVSPSPDQLEAPHTVDDEQVYVHLSPTEIRAAHLHVHLMFTPDQRNTWTLLERQFPKWSEREFNAAVAHLEAEDAVSIDPHPDFSEEYIISILYPGDSIPAPLPHPHFMMATAAHTPTGTATGSTSISTSENLTPIRSMALPGFEIVRLGADTVVPPPKPEVRGREEESSVRWSHTPPRPQIRRGTNAEEDRRLAGMVVGWEGIKNVEREKDFSLLIQRSVTFDKGEFD